MNRENRVEIGWSAEKVACQYLSGLNYQILLQNYHSAYGEIDIIAQEGNTLVFAEVKFRTRKNIDSALNTVSRSKQKKLIKTACHYLATHDDAETLYTRFDVILIFPEKESNHFDILHYKDAFTTDDGDFES